MSEISKILIAEDDEVHAALLRKYFAKADYPKEIFFAESKADALELFESGDYDYVITDLKLTDGSGLDIVKFAREKGVGAAVITAHGDEELAAKAIKTGATDYFVKNSDLYKKLPEYARSACLERKNRLEKARIAEENRNRNLRFKLVFEHSLDAILWVDAGDGEIIDANPSAEKLLDIEKLYLIGSLMFDFVAPRDLDKFHRIFRGAETKASLVDSIILLKSAKGAEFAVRISRTSAFLEDREIIQLILKYVGELQEAKEKIRIGEENFRMVADHMLDLIWKTDVMGNIEYAAPSVEKTLGYSAEQMVGTSFLKYLDEDSAERMEIYLRTIVRDVKPFKAEISVFKRNSDLAQLELAGNIIFDYEKKAKGVVLSARDVTKRNEDQRKFIEMQKAYKSVFDNVLDIYYRTDLDGKIILISNSAAKTFGYDSIDEMIGKNIAVLFGVEEKASYDLLSKLMENERLKSEEAVFRKSDGSEIIVEIHATLIKDEKGRPVFADGAIRDVTLKKQAENRIKHLNKELERRVEERTAELEEALRKLQIEVDKQKQTQKELSGAKENLAKSLEKEKKLVELKSQFIATVSHEYRTPMTVILSSTYVLEKLFELGLKDEFKSQLEKIQASIDEMTALIEKVLFIEKTEKAKVYVVKEPIEMVDFWKTVTEEFSINNPKGIYFKFSAEIKPTEFPSDRKLLHTVASNLLRNAVVFSPKESKVRVTLSEDKDYYVVRIDDEGIGVHRDDLPHLTESFYRGRNVEAAPGSGLGLTIVARALDALGGELKIESELDAGTTVVVKLRKNISDKNDG